LKKLKKKIDDKSAVVGIIGLGYVGLPLAVAFAEAGFKVLGFDIQQKTVDKVDRGTAYTARVSQKRLGAVVSGGLLQATTGRSRLSEVDIVCICVPTPLTKTKNPDLSYVISEANEIARYIHRGQLIILESTTYPGTTREVVLPILETSGLKCGGDFFLAFSPERVDPGGVKYNIRNTPKIVGGIDPASTELAANFYGRITDSVISLSSPEAAEMTKVFENVFRSVNIALVNELAKLCEKMNINVWEVIKSASSKPFGYMPFYPGPGVGGNSITRYPYFLANKAREYDFHTRFIELAADINESMPYYVASRIMGELNGHDVSLGGAKILVFGAAYKKDVADMHESPAIKLIDILQKKGACVSYYDPYIPQIRLSSGVQSSVKLDYSSLKSFDCTVIATAHSVYDYNKIVRNSRLVFDSRGVTCDIKGRNIVRFGE
jgi:UDP-N-acetyl-D-glucosamine dehydrogenase